MFVLKVLNNKVITGKTFDEIKDKLYEWQREYDIGSSQWTWGKLTNHIGSTYLFVGWVSYNGRLWAEKP